MDPEKLSRTDAGVSWLGQFDVADQPAACALLDGITLNRFTLKRDHRKRATWPAILLG
jgi:hypothetical protein